MSNENTPGITPEHLVEEVLELFGTGSKKGRGKAKRSLQLIDAMYRAAEDAHPITGRGIPNLRPHASSRARDYSRGQ
jgi:hypothetical protein